MLIPVVDGRPGQDHRVVVGPLGRVAPALLVAVPEVAACGVAHNALRKTLPDSEGKVHLDGERDTRRVYKLCLKHLHTDGSNFITIRKGGPLLLEQVASFVLKYLIY